MTPPCSPPAPQQLPTNDSRLANFRAAVQLPLAGVNLGTAMGHRIAEGDDRLEAYIVAMGTRETAIMARLRAETDPLPASGMQIGADQGALLGLLIRLTGAKRALEIGTFTGYSALAVASALPDDGHLTCCDVSEEWTSIGQRYWREAGVESKITLKIAPATETLAGLEAAGHGHGFDFAFIDADKESYDSYYESCLRLIRPGGLIAIDNVLWDGEVADPEKVSASTVALRALNAKIREDQRVDFSLVPIGDGLTLVRPR